ncbi:hypothetical protein ACOSZC_02565 [Marinobacter salsuginis]
MNKTHFFLIFAVALTGCASTGGGSGGEIEISGIDDQLEDQVKVSSFSFSRPFMGVVPRETGDPFFRAYIEKTGSKQKSLQLYVLTNNSDWMHWDEARFRMDGELVKIPMTRVGSNVDCSQYGCSHFEDVVGSVTDEQVQFIAKQQQPVTVRLTSSRVSGNTDFQIPPGEAKAFLKALKAATP